MEARRASVETYKVKLHVSRVLFRCTKTVDPLTTSGIQKGRKLRLKTNE